MGNLDPARRESPRQIGLSPSTSASLLMPHAPLSKDGMHEAFFVAPWVAYKTKERGEEVREKKFLFIPHKLGLYTIYI